MIFSNMIFDGMATGDLEARLHHIREIVKPVFEDYGHYLSDELVSANELDQKPPVHVAKHLQRSVHPPDITWVAIGGDRRGYKKYIHFEIVLTADTIGFYLVCIDNPAIKQDYVAYLQANRDLLKALPSDYVVNVDHTQKEFTPLNQVNIEHVIDRLSNIKKAELMLGKVWQKSDVLLKNEEKIKQELKGVLTDLHVLFLAMNDY